MLSVDMVNVTFKPSLLSVIMLNVDILSVVAPNFNEKKIIKDNKVIGCQAGPNVMKIFTSVIYRCL
jgi:hypothetical protein